MTTDTAVLPVCCCVEHDRLHVHLPAMVDSQYGLRIHLAAPPRPPGTARDGWSTLVTEGEATGCYPCDTCNGFRAKGRPCSACAPGAATHKET